MSESVVTLLLIIFFSMIGFRELQSNTVFGLFLGGVSILIAVGFILGAVTRF